MAVRSSVRWGGWAVLATAWFAVLPFWTVGPWLILSIGEIYVYILCFWVNGFFGLRYFVRVRGFYPFCGGCAMVVCVRCGLVGCDCEVRARLVLEEFMDRLGPLGRVSRVTLAVGEGVGDTDGEV